MNVNASAHLHDDSVIRIFRCGDGGFAMTFGCQKYATTYVSIFGATKDLLTLRDRITEYLVEAKCDHD